MAKVILDFEKPIYELEQKIEEMKQLSDKIDISQQIEDLQGKINELKADIYKNLTRWQRVQIARHPDRPQTMDYIQNIFEDFVELHGDRKFGDDHAIVGGLAKFKGQSVLVVGHQKGKDTKIIAKRFKEIAKKIESTAIYA